LVNDNDKAQQYFQGTFTQKEVLDQQKEFNSGNVLIEKLRQQTADNSEKNKMQVARKTIENDMAASFGPFDKQVAILNTDGRTYTLLQNPQAMRLKDAGFIKDRVFVTQPTSDELEKALAPQEGGLFKGFFGGSD
jgi:hypothetical protein